MSPTTPRIKAILDQVQGPDILSVGCAGTIRPDSDEWLHGALVRRFPGVLGLDRDPVAVERLQRVGYAAVVADAQAFALARRFHTIVAGDVIEHLENPGAFLRCCREHLVPGGRVVLSTCYAFGLANLIRAFVRYPDTCSNREHVAWYCPSTLTEVCKRAGFVVTECALTDSYVIHDTPWTYNTFVGAQRLMKPLLPRRLSANTLLAVLRDGPGAPN